MLYTNDERAAELLIDTLNNMPYEYYDNFIKYTKHLYNIHYMCADDVFCELFLKAIINKQSKLIQYLLKNMQDSIDIEYGIIKAVQYNSLECLFLLIKYIEDDIDIDMGYFDDNDNIELPMLKYVLQLGFHIESEYIDCYDIFI